MAFCQSFDHAHVGQQRFSGSGWDGDQRVAAFEDARNCIGLWGMQPFNTPISLEEIKERER